MGDPISADSTSARALAQRALGLLFLAGSLVGAISLLLPHGSRAHDGILWGNTALAVITGAALLLLPALPSWLLQATLAGGTLVITRAVYYGGGDSFYVVWYVWVAAYGFSFLSRRQSAAQVALVAVAYAAVLTHAPGHAPLPRWLTTVATLAITGVFLDALAGRVRRQSERLEELALTDPLTGLPNRRAWEQQLPGELARAQRDGRPLCLALLDLDHFKAFNDRHGHPAGDALLRDAATAWSRELRAGDLLARYGGEEFVLVLPNCSPDEAAAIADRVRARTPGGETCSIGVAPWDGSHPLEELVDRADAALYDAKLAGRDRVRVHPAAARAFA
jgi:diguanylate cyclase (GGDEF)-like protein